MHNKNAKSYANGEDPGSIMLWHCLPNFLQMATLQVAI